MNLHHLAVFNAIAETGGVSAAAERLHITQPAVSHQLKELEDRLGVVLFNRMPRGMQLTQAGSVLLDYARQIFALERSAETAIRDIASLKGGHVALGASNTVGTYFLPELLAAFRKRYPGITASLEVSNTDAIALGVSSHRLALGFVEGPVDPKDLEIRQFHEDEIIAVAAPDHSLAKRKRIALKLFAKEPILIREAGSGTRNLIEQLFAERHLAPDHAMEIGNAEATKRAVVAGAGVACLSRLCVADELASGQLVALDIPELVVRRPLNMIQLKKRHIGPSAEAFIRVLSEWRGSMLAVSTA